MKGTLCRETKKHQIHQECYFSSSHCSPVMSSSSVISAGIRSDDSLYKYVMSVLTCPSGQTQAAAPASVRTKKASEYAGSCRCSAGGRRAPFKSGRVLSSTIFNTSPFSLTDLIKNTESTHQPSLYSDVQHVSSDS